MRSPRREGGMRFGVSRGSLALARGWQRPEGVGVRSGRCLKGDGRVSESGE